METQFAGGLVFGNHALAVEAFVEDGVSAFRAKVVKQPGGNTADSAISTFLRDSLMFGMANRHFGG